MLYASTCFEHYYAHHQKVKIVLYSIWYHHTCRWPSGAQSSLNPCTERPPTVVTIPDAKLYNIDLLMMSTQCSKHVEAYNKLIIKQEFCALSWLITKIILRCTVSKTSKYVSLLFRSSVFQYTNRQRISVTDLD